LALPAFLNSPAGAQSSGFKEGELFVYAPAIQAPGYSGAGILRTDPLSGASAMLVKAQLLSDVVGSMVFDSHRQRVVFSAALPGIDASPVTYLWFVDGYGNLLNITKNTALAGVAFANLAPGKAGRLYCTTNHDTSKPIRYLDANNQLQTLFAADGVTPMRIDGLDNYLIEGLIYEPNTNALFVASTQPAPGFPLGAVNVRKLPLSADGSRVVGPVGNATFEVSPAPWGATSGETPRGWSYGPNGKLILIILTIDDEILPRMLEIDPVSSAISVWGSNGSETPGQAWSTTTGGSYTPSLGKVVVLDYWNAKLRAYAKGSSGGNGTVIPTAPIQPGGYYVNIATVPDDKCNGVGFEYGTGLAGSGGIVPRLVSSGCPGINQVFELRLNQALGGSSGLLLIGFSPSSLPILGGTQLVSPIAATLPILAAGVPGAPGAGGLALPIGFTDPLFVGLTFYLQAGFFDAGAVNGVSLTNGLGVTIGA
jgi:hypothetical protein